MATLPGMLPCNAPALWLVRHGESTWNALGLAQGHRDDAELTERGAAQAHRAANSFRGVSVSALYSSDLRRAMQTAAVFAEVLGVKVAPDARLRERNLGDLEGAPFAEVTPAAAGIDGGLVLDPDARPPGGESVRDLYRRAAAFCHDIERRPAGRAGDVVVVAHGGTLRVLRAYLSGIAVERMRWEPVENTRVLRIDGAGTNARGGTE